MPLLSLTACAAELKCSKQTLRYYILSGVATKTDGKYDPVLIRAQLEKRDLDKALNSELQDGGPALHGGTLRKERERTEKFRADLLGLDFAERQSVLVDVEKISQVYATRLASARELLLSLPDRLAPELSVMTDVVQISDYIGREIKSALRLAVA